MLKTRILTSVIILPPIVFAVWYGGAAYILLLVLAGGAIGWEIAHLSDISAPLPLVAFLAILAGTPLISEFAGFLPGALWIATGLLFFGVLAAANLASVPDRVGLLALCSLSQLALFSLVYLRGIKSGGAETILFVIAVIAATDIGGYFAGKSIGGLRLAPRISPNKTWAGLAGGMVLAGVVGYALAISPIPPFSIGHSEGAPEWSPLTIALMSVALAPIAQTGDLLESWVKRCRGVKDSGSIVPGHGGILDRVDGYLTAAPLVALIALTHEGGPFAWP